MKIKMLTAAIVGSLVAATAFGATGANAATASATARAKILRQVTVTNNTDLQFGTIVTSTTASNVDISTAGARTCGTGLVCSGTVSAAGFTIGGTTGQVTTVSIPASVTLTQTSGTATMAASLTSSAATVTMVANAGTFAVGGSLAVGASQADGDYVGSFTATVNYQ